MGWRQRAFAITGVVVGLGGAVLFSLATRKLDAFSSAVALAVYTGVLIPFALFLWKVTRRTRCPKCQSDQAQLVYDPRGSEYVECPACGCRQATGHSLPND